LKCPEGEISGCWKNPRGMQEGYLEGWQYEIAAYEMDKLVDLNMIPPTVERIFMGKKGSIQFWIENPMSDKNRMDQGIKIPEEHRLRWTKYKYLMRAFDCLIGNEDRTQQNIRYDDEWNIILIDHSRSFRSVKKFTKNLPYGKKGVVEVQPFRFLPRAFVEKIKGLTFEEIIGAVGNYLTQKEINAVLKRRDLILAEIEEMIKEKGEKAVLY